MNVLWYRISAPHFVACIRFTNDIADHSAPILRRNIGKSFHEFMRVCRQQRWKCEFLAEDAKIVGTTGE